MYAVQPLCGGLWSCWLGLCFSHLELVLPQSEALVDLTTNTELLQEECLDSKRRQLNQERPTSSEKAFEHPTSHQIKVKTTYLPYTLGCGYSILFG